MGRKSYTVLLLLKKKNYSRQGIAAKLKIDHGHFKEKWIDRRGRRKRTIREGGRMKFPAECPLADHVAHKRNVAQSHIEY